MDIIRFDQSVGHVTPNAGNNRFLVKNRQQGAAMIVGNEGFLFGFRPVGHATNSFGELNKPDLLGLPVYQLTVNQSNDVLVVQFGDQGDNGRQYRDITRLRLTVDRSLVSDVVYNGTRYEGASADINNYLVSKAGESVLVQLRPIS